MSEELMKLRSKKRYTAMKLISNKKEERGEWGLDLKILKKGQSN